MTEAVCPTKPKILSLWPLAENVPSPVLVGTIHSKIYFERNAFYMPSDVLVAAFVWLEKICLYLFKHCFGKPFLY